jgi:hypothetical protein
MNALKRFKFDQSGTTAVLFSLTIIPLLAVSGMAVDYSRAANARTVLQKAADSAALQMITSNRAGRFPDVTALVKENFNTGLSPKGLKVAGRWVKPGSVYEIKAQSDVDTTFSFWRMIEGQGFSLERKPVVIGVVSVAEGMETFVKQEIEGANLNPEAVDFNELSGYCFNPKTKTRLGPIDPLTNKRLPFLKIADNSPEGLKIKPTNLALNCLREETHSYYIKNVRNARLSPALRSTNTTFHYYNDTTIEEFGADKGSLKFNPVYPNTVETILCNSKAECRTKSEGGILDNKTPSGRTPKLNTKICSPSQYLSIGWEDRPPGFGWSDTDYDDIRLVVSCPSGSSIPGPIRLIQ